MYHFVDESNYSPHFSQIFLSLNRLSKCPELLDEKSIQTSQSISFSTSRTSSFIYRAILLYARSDVVPIIGSSKEVSSFVSLSVLLIF